MAARSWQVEIGFDGYGHPEVRVSVDDLELLPQLTTTSAVHALEYIDEALIDFQHGDPIALVLRRSPEVMSVWTTRIRSLALHWCADVLQQAWAQQVALGREGGRAARFAASQGRATAREGGSLN